MTRQNLQRFPVSVNLERNVWVAASWEKSNNLLKQILEPYGYFEVLTTIIWIERDKLWKDQNDLSYSIENNKCKKTAQNKVELWLEEIYQQHYKYLSKDRDLLIDSVNNHKKILTYSIQNWIQLHINHFKDITKQAKERALQGVSITTTYFKTFNTKKET